MPRLVADLYAQFAESEKLANQRNLGKFNLDLKP